MMKAKSFSMPKDKTTDPHAQVKGKGGVTSMAVKQHGQGMAKVMLQRKSKKVPATGI